jgi:hypothetical protein
VYKKAKDILRASRLQLLPVDNPHVKSDLAKIAKNKAPSPILLIRGDINTDVACRSQTAITASAPATTLTRTPTSPAESRDHQDLSGGQTG